MSIYPVKICEWWPKGNKHREDVEEMLLYLPCLTCGKKVTTRGYLDHSAPYGGPNRAYCSMKCMTT